MLFLLVYEQHELSSHTDYNSTKIYIEYICRKIKSNNYWGNGIVSLKGEYNISGNLMPINIIGHIKQMNRPNKFLLSRLKSIFLYKKDKVLVSCLKNTEKLAVFELSGAKKGFS